LNNLFSWILEKIKQSESRRKARYISKFLTAKKVEELESLIGYSIRNKTYFIQALTHRSFLEEHNDYDFSNERLEFLGDSVLNLIVGEYIFDSFPDKDEGFLTKIRAKLVNRIALAEAASQINLGNFLLVSKNLSNIYTNASKTVLSDAFEALIGAIYLDKDLEAARHFITKALITPNVKDGVYLIDENFKSQLLEYAQANKLEIPNYVVINEEGPQHDRIFTILVRLGNREVGSGKGKNKKSAEQNAARDAMNNILNKT